MNSLRKFLLFFVPLIFFYIISEAQLKSFLVSPVRNPGLIDVVTFNNEDAALIINSSIKDLNFSSSIAGIDNKPSYNAVSNHYILFIKPKDQIIYITHPNYTQSTIEIENIKRKETRYYSVEAMEDVFGSIKAGEFYANSDPSGAQIAFDQYPDWTTKLPHKYQIPALSYKVTVSNSDYESLDTIILLKPDKPNSITFHLIPKFSKIIFDVDPSNVEILIDETRSNSFGNLYSSNKFFRVDLGTRKITFKAPHYYSFDTTITAIPFKEFTIVKQLKPILGSLTINTTGTDAIGAEIYLDNNEKKIGEIPLYDYPLQEGVYKLNVRKKGMKDYTEEITISENKRLVKNIEMVSIMDVYIKTFPDDADIKIDNILSKKSNCKVKLPIGTYTVVISKNGYETITENLLVSKYEISNSFSYTLSKVLLNVTLHTRPRDVSVSGDGVNTIINGNSKTVKLPLGKHEIEFSKDRFYNKKKNINVTRNWQEFKARLFPVKFGMIGFSYGLNMLSLNLSGCVAKHFYLGGGLGLNLTQHGFKGTIAVKNANIDDISSYSSVGTVKSDSSSITACFNLKIGCFFQKPINFIVSVGYAGTLSRKYQNVYQAKQNYASNDGTIINSGEYFTSPTVFQKSYQAFTAGLAFPITRRFFLGADFYTYSEVGMGLVFNGGVIF
jgi:hypothetical protein